MKKVCASMMVVLFVMASPLLADTITLQNTVVFGKTGITSSGDGSAALLGYGAGVYGRANRIDDTSDYVSWSQTFVFDAPADNDTVLGTLTLYLIDDYSKTSIDGHEFAEVSTGSTQLSSGEVETGTYTYDVVLDNGTLVVNLKSLGGDFYIDKAVLGVTYNTAAAPVPEPASILLLGVGMISAGFFARRRNKQG